MDVFIFGNGMSYQPTGGRLSLPTLTPKVWAWLEDEGLAGLVRQIVKWSNPQQPELDDGAHDENFEKIAGALDRLAHAVRAIEPLVASSVPLAGDLDAASKELRHLYVRVVGAALHAVDDAVRPTDLHADGYVGADRGRTHAMARALWERHEELGLAIYTLNYDSLVMEALMELRDGRYIYDGFPGGAFDGILDRRPNTLSYYPLHGTLGTYQTTTGTLRKRTMDNVRAQGVLIRWRAGEVDAGIPAVVLGDAKGFSVQQEPFSTYYDALQSDLEDAEQVIVGGYGFGDVPLNSRLARHLARHPNMVIRDWRPNAVAHRDEVLQRLRGALPAGTIADAQIVAEDVFLPDAAAVSNL